MRRRIAVIVLAAGGAGGLAGCGGKEAEAWIGPRSAVVRCTSPGRQRMPPVLLDVPVPAPPTGLYARALDPMALDEMGYQRDELACAVLQAPEPSTVQAVGITVSALVATHEAASTQAVRAGGRCTCEIAHDLGVRELVAVCSRTPTQTGCDPAEGRDAMQVALAPLQSAIEATSLPLVHWRLAGRTDRPGWFSERLDTLVAKHPGGSTIYRRGQAVATRDNYRLLRALLEHDHVVAVVRQDAGRALLVAREIGNTLVLDHFAYTALDPDLHPLLGALDNAHVDDYVRALTRPEDRRAPGLPPREGTLVEVDRARLEDVDALLVAASPLTGRRYEEDAEMRDAPDVLVDHIALQAPFGADGAKLVVRFELSEAGRLWAQTLGDGILSPTLDELGLAGRGPEHVPAEPALDFHLRGTPTDLLLVHGLHLVPPLMRRIEMNDPSSVQGRADAWRFELPAADPTPEADPIVLRALRDRIASRPHVVQAELDPARETLKLELRPR